MDWEFGVNRVKLLHLEWRRDSKVLLYSTGKYVQSPGIDRDEKLKKKKECTSISIYLHTFIYT